MLGMAASDTDAAGCFCRSGEHPFLVFRRCKVTGIVLREFLDEITNVLSLIFYAKERFRRWRSHW